MNFSTHKQTLLNLASKARQLAKTLKREEQAVEFKAAMTLLERSVYRVVFVGEYKRGKSSLINNLLNLGETEHATPVNVDVATSVAIRIYHAKTPAATVHYAPSAGTKPHPITIRDIRDYATEVGNPGNTRKVAFIEVGIPSPALADGVEFIDTPGVGGMNASHSEVTYLVLPKADQAVHVSSSTDPMSKAELDFVRVVLRDQKKPLFVITKRDLARDWAAAAADLRMKLGSFIDPPPDASQVFSISNASYEVFLATGNTEDLKNSGFPEFRAALHERIDQVRAAAVITPAHFQVTTSLQGMAKLAQSQLDVLKTLNEKDIKEKQQQLAAKRAQLDRLREQPSWYDMLGTSLRELNIDLSTRLDNAFIDLNANLTRYAQEEYYHEHPDAIDSLINSELSTIGASISKRMESGADAIYARIIEASKLDISSIAAEYATQHRGTGALSVKDRSQGLIGGMFEIIRGAFTDTALGFAVGGLFTPIGAVVGAIIGFFNGIGRVLRGRRQSNSEQIRRQLMDHYGPSIGKARVEYRNTMEKSLSKVGTMLRDGIRQAVEKESRLVSEQSKELEDALHMTRESTQKEIRRLESELAAISALLRECQEAAGPQKN